MPILALETGVHPGNFGEPGPKRGVRIEADFPNPLGLVNLVGANCLLTRSTTNG